MRNLIGLIGASSAGKTTTTNVLCQEHGYTRLAMSCVLKDMLRALGFTEEDVEGPQTHRHKRQARLGGMSPRQVASSLGTEWARNLVHPDLLVNAVRWRVLGLLADGHRVALDGVRYPNEWGMVWGLGGEVWCVRNPEFEPKRTWYDRLNHRFGRHPNMHESEYHWRDCKADRVLWNMAGRNLREQVER